MENFITKKLSESKFEKWVDKNCDSDSNLICVDLNDRDGIAIIIDIYGPDHRATYNYNERTISASIEDIELFF